MWSKLKKIRERFERKWIFDFLFLLAILIIGIQIWMVGRILAYQLIHEGKVKETIREMVKEECLKSTTTKIKDMNLEVEDEVGKEVIGWFNDNE